jgi:hypothetical protein
VQLLQFLRPSSNCRHARHVNGRVTVHTRLSLHARLETRSCDVHAPSATDLRLSETSSPRIDRRRTVRSKWGKWLILSETFRNTSVTLLTMQSVLDGSKPLLSFWGRPNSAGQDDQEPCQGFGFSC